MPDDTFVKRRLGALPGFFDVEAAGLRWLGAAEEPGGVRVATPLEVTAESLTLPRLHEITATDEAAETFGRALAATHRSGGDWFGCPPAGWSGDGFIGTLPLPHVPTPDHPDAASWGRFYAGHRIRPFLRAALDAHRLSEFDARAIEKVCLRLDDGDETLSGPPEPVARLHGDLWAGNVLWTADGVVLIDPAAHGGHRETDLAMLALFGLPRLDRVLAAYHETWPLAEGWRDRVLLHQLHPLLVHAVLFGGSYSREAGRAARRYL